MKKENNNNRIKAAMIFPSKNTMAQIQALHILTISHKDMAAFA